jgi:hypothetical protein
MAVTNFTMKLCVDAGALTTFATELKARLSVARALNGDEGAVPDYYLQAAGEAFAACLKVVRPQQ